MAVVRINHKSEVIGKAMEMTLIVPDHAKKEKMRVLYLLHGLSDDCTNWLRYSSIERYVRNNNDTIIVMPDGGKSFYTDMAHGEKYYSYITEEVPGFLKSIFNISDSREDTYIAGLSMGGYGAVKIALRNPDRYSAAASFSGVLDIKSLLEINPDFKANAEEILGKDFSLDNSDENLLYLLKKEFKNKPRILQMCGTEDFLYQNNLNFKKEIEKLDFPYEYREGPGEHNWNFWDEAIQYALDFFGIER